MSFWTGCLYLKVALTDLLHLLLCADDRPVWQPLPWARESSFDAPNEFSISLVLRLNRHASCTLPAFWMRISYQRSSRMTVIMRYGRSTYCSNGFLWCPCFQDGCRLIWPLRLCIYHDKRWWFRASVTTCGRCRKTREKIMVREFWHLSSK